MGIKENELLYSNVMSFDPYAGYAREIESINGELKTLRTRERQLLAQRGLAQTHLHTLMRSTNLTKYKSFTLRSLAPKKRPRYRPPKSLKAATIAYYRSVGIENPEHLHEQVERLKRAPPSAKE